MGPTSRFSTVLLMLKALNFTLDDLQNLTALAPFLHPPPRSEG